MLTYTACPAHRKAGFTLIELLVVISIIALLIGILLPALGAARGTAREMICATRIRGFQQGMVIFAQENNSYYPGLDSQGRIVHMDDMNTDSVTYSESHGASNGARQSILLSRQYITPEYAISPSDQKEEWDPSSGDGIKTHNISFSSLAIATHNTPGSRPQEISSSHDGRAGEWRDTMNGSAVVMSDRPIIPPGGGNASLQETGDLFSVHTEYTGGPNWRGHMVFNDNHVETSSTPVASTRYLDGPRVGHDNIFLFESQQASDDEVSGGGSAFAYEACMMFLGHNQRVDGNDPLNPF